MFEPQDLPERYGRVVKALDHILNATGIPAVLAGGWAVWRYGFTARVAEDIDIVLPAAAVDQFRRAATVFGFDVLTSLPGHWPRLLHRGTGIEVGLLSEGGRPGMPNKPAPTTIPHPTQLGAAKAGLHYIDLPGLIELKLAAGQIGGEHDIVELIRANPERVNEIREHLQKSHATYFALFAQLVERAAEQG